MKRVFRLWDKSIQTGTLTVAPDGTKCVIYPHYCNPASIEVAPYDGIWGSRWFDSPEEVIAAAVSAIEVECAARIEELKAISLPMRPVPMGVPETEFGGLTIPERS